MKLGTRILVAFLLVVTGVAILVGPYVYRHGRDHAVAKRATYHCPMHPTIVDDKPSDCPICGMRLVPIDSAGAQVVPAGATSSVPGLVAVTILPEARQRMGLVLGTAERRALTRTIRTSARIVPDESRLFRVTTKVEGWVDKLIVSTTGQAVAKGDPLLTLYSPQLVAAQQEFLVALQAVNRLPPEAGTEAADSARRLLAASRQRLQFWDVSCDPISRLAKTGAVEKTLTLYAPATGFVTEKAVLAGQKIAPGDSLMVVTDLAEVWGEADLYAADLPYVRTGMPMQLTLPYWPDKTFTGQVMFVASAVDPDTRTVKTRIAIPNADLLLKLGMYAEARLSYAIGETLAVPESAVLRTGEQTYVFRDGSDGRLEPVAVQLGARADGYCEVRAGLQAGDRVVVSANFLVDSESSMRAAIEALTEK